MMASALFAVAAFIAAVLWAYRSRRKLSLLRAYEEAMGTFFKDADTLLAAEETPAEVVDMIEFISDKAADPRAATEFLRVLLRRRREMAEGENGELSRAVASFVEGYPQLGRVFGRAMARGLLAMTFKGGLTGTFVRRLVLFDAKKHEDRTQDLATNFRQIEACVPHAQAA